MDKKLFGKNHDGKDVYAFTLSNEFVEVTVLTYGATVQSLKYKGKERVLGYDSLEEYVSASGYLGATVGRYAGRIGGAKFNLGGKEYKLFKNEGENCLHGGQIGFDKRVWDVDEDGTGENFVEMKYVSQDGEEGFPGNLTVKVRFSVSGKTFSISYYATTDKDTYINLTNHTYFNLLGDQVIDTHYFKLDADAFMEIDEEMIPTGRKMMVEGTPMDFRRAKSIFRDIDADDAQINIAGGYDHNFVINGNGFRKFAELSTTVDGVWMRAYTDRPCVQFYSGNFLGKIAVHGGVIIGKRCGLCLETQGYPNSMNVGDVKADLLKASEEYRSETQFLFGEFC